MAPYVTHHAEKRVRQRIGSRNAVRLAGEALLQGLSADDTTGDLRKHLEWVRIKSPSCCKVRLYKSLVYVFVGDVFVTVMPLPGRLSRAAAKACAGSSRRCVP